MDCNCLHDHGPDGRDEPGEMSAAHKSLADALHVSFRLLGVAMIVMLVAWLTLTGMSCVDTSERAVRVVLGEIAGKEGAQVHGEGLLWNWPQPFGKVVRVSTSEQTLTMRDFWMSVPANQAGADLDEIVVRSQGLVPGQDGALLTGDRGLIHAIFVCTYKTGVRGNGPEDRAVIDYVTRVADSPGGAEAFVRDAVSQAAIRVASALTLEHIRNHQLSFADQVQAGAQRRLGQLRTGIQLSKVEIGGLTEPLAARPAFKDFTIAQQDKDAARTAANREAIKVLTKAAGESWRILAGDLDVLDAGGGSADGDALRHQVEVFNAYDRAQRAGDILKTAALAREVSRFGLLNLYAQAREDERDELARRVLEQIDRVFVSNTTGGDAGRKINEARNYSTRVRNLAAARAEQFRELLPGFKDTPDLIVQGLWAVTKTRILTNPKVEKFYVPRTQRFVLRINEDPEVRTRIDREKLKDKQAEKDRQTNR